MEDIYSYPEDTGNRYAIPERKDEKDRFLYSILAAYIRAPLALLRYYTAKTVMILINLVAYVCAMILIFRMANVSGRWVAWGTAISVLWLPLLSTLMYGQVNAVILLLVTTGVFVLT